MNDIESGGYLELLADIKQRIRLAQYDALKAVTMKFYNHWLEI
ncbi:MAG: hypothetical protein WA144_02610 [Candidatus Methanoperedens sp.]